MNTEINQLQSLKIYIYIIQKMKVKNLGSKNTKIKLQIMKEKTKKKVY